MSKEEILNKLFQSNIPQQYAALLWDIGKYMEVKNKRNLVNINEQCTSAFFILKGGFVNQYIDSATGEERTINFFLHNFQPINSILKSYFTGSPANLQIKAITNSSVLVVKKSDIDKLASKNQEFKEWYLQKIIDALLVELESKTNLITLSNKEMYQYLLNEESEVIKQVPSVYIAQFIGISREHLSRIRKGIEFF